MCNPKNLADEIIKNYNYFSGPKSLLKIIESLLLCQGYNEIQAYEYASEILLSVRDEISKILEQNRKSAVVSTCELIGDDYCTIIGTAYKRPTDTEEILFYRESVPFYNEILDCLCTLDPRDFELFCKKLLTNMGASEAITTKPSRDDGIDFLARISLPSSFGYRGIGSFEETFSFVVFGQAKRYQKEIKVRTPEIRDLIGSSIILKYDELIYQTDTMQRLKFGNIKLCEPLQCLFLTTGQFSNPAQQLADKTGVVIKDGSQLATYIALHRIGFKKYDKLVFNGASLLEWIRS